MSSRDDMYRKPCAICTMCQIFNMCNCICLEVTVLRLPTVLVQERMCPHMREGSKCWAQVIAKQWGKGLVPRRVPFLLFYGLWLGSYKLVALLYNLLCGKKYTVFHVLRCQHQHRLRQEVSSGSWSY